MPGDKITAKVYAKYVDTSDPQVQQALRDFLASLGTGNNGGPLLDGGAPGSLGGGIFPFTTFFNHDDEDGSGPKAYLNYLLYDRDFNPLNGGFKRLTVNGRETGETVGTPLPNGGFDVLAFEDDDIKITEPGFVYIYFSNENESRVEVFFDDFEVAHTKSPVVQQDDYYPFGLTFNSSQREKNIFNRYQFNSKEKQNELNLNWSDYGARMYLPELGRWNGGDRMAEKYFPLSSYAFALNNPIILVDPNGMDVTAVAGGYQYTGLDAANAFRFFMNINRKSVYIALIENDKLRKSTNTKTDYGQWNVLGVKSAQEATTMMEVAYGNGTLDNLVYEAHGGITQDTRKNFFKTRVNDGAERPPDAEKINNYMRHGYGSRVGYVKNLMGYVKDDGNSVFNTYQTMSGTDGDKILRGLSELSGNRLNIYGAESFVVHSGYSKGNIDKGLRIWGTLNDEEYNKSMNVQASWKSIRNSTGPITHYSGVTITNKEGSSLECVTP
jgi:RHS repeat-associated protein